MLRGGLITEGCSSRITAVSAVGIIVGGIGRIAELRRSSVSSVSAILIVERRLRIVAVPERPILVTLEGITNSDVNPLQ